MNESPEQRRIISLISKPIIVYPRDTTSLLPPKTIYARHHNIFLPLESEWGDSFVVGMTKGVAAGRRLCRQDGSLIWAYDRRSGGLEDIQQATHFRGSIGLLNTSDFSYPNWFFHELPKLHLFRKAGCRFSRIYTSCKNDFQKRTLELLGYKPDKIISIEDNPIISADKMWIGYYNINKRPSWLCSFLRDKFLQPEILSGQSSCPKRVYISRARGYRRVISNEVQLVRLLQTKYGFVNLLLEDLSFEDQLRIFNNADVVMAAHGGSLTNIMFCHKGAKVIEIFGMNKCMKMFYLTAQTIGLDYYYLIQRGVSSLSFVDRINSEKFLPDDQFIKVSLRDIRRILRVAQINPLT